MASLAAWIERQLPVATNGMLAAVSAVDVVKTRPGFGQAIRPRRGSIVASPVPASYDPDPDYFFHWFRDSAVVIDALRLAHEAGLVGAEALGHFGDFVAFSRALDALDGRALVAAPAWRERVTPSFVQYLRTDVDLGAVHGDAVVAETRVNPDGTLDISRWARPQHDGPPLRALALARWLAGPAALDASLATAAAALLDADLDFTARRWHEPSYDIWEEEDGEHYYTLRVSAAALEAGAASLELRAGSGSGAAALRAGEYRRAVQAIRARLDAFWLPNEGFFRSRVLRTGARSAKELDIAVILAAIHVDDGAPGATEHSVHDPRMQSTLARLEALFDARYPINRDRGPARGPAMGRYDGDVYYAGGAYFFSTLGAAEFCFRAAAGAADPADWIARGDAYLATVRAHVPDNGEMSEQFDQRTGAQASARHLAWSYAGFISCIAARRRAVTTGA